MAASVSGSKEKANTPAEEFMADEEEAGGEFEEAAEDETPVPIAVKDPSIRRKIEDRLERNRLRDELGIYDANWDDI